MTNMLQSGITWLAAQLQASAAVAITYTRSATTIVADATPGVTDWTAASDNSITAAWTSRDFIMKLSDLDTLSPAIPVRGDTIAEVGADGVTRTYEVLAPQGAQHYRLMGQCRDLVRIHTKLVSEV